MIAFDKKGKVSQHVIGVFYAKQAIKVIGIFQSTFFFTIDGISNTVMNTMISHVGHMASL